MLSDTAAAGNMGGSTPLQLQLQNGGNAGSISASSTAGNIADQLLSDTPSLPQYLPVVQGVQQAHDQTGVKRSRTDHTIPEGLLTQMQEMQQRWAQTMTESMVAMQNTMHKQMMDFLQLTVTTQSNSKPSPPSQLTTSEEKLPSDLVKKISLAKQKYERRLRQHDKCKDHLKKAQEDYDLMKNDTSKKRYPPGYHPWKPIAAGAELDDPWEMSKDQDHTITLTIPKSTSVHNAMELLHHHSIKWRTQMWLQYQQARINTLQKDIQNTAFQDLCNQAVQDYEKNH